MSVENEAIAAKPKDHQDVATSKIGVLLINLGTPDGTDTKSMRRYLKEFLSDPRIIETSRIIWWPILNGYILNTRPKKSGALYASIWNNELNESPLRTHSREQSEKLAQAFDNTPNVVVDWAMRYGKPSIASRIDYLKEQGCERILIFPLYPQYSATTTATVNDKAFEALKAMRWQPAIRTVPPYFDDPIYIDALALSIEQHLAHLDFEPEKIIASFHGIPKAYFDKGDPYYCHCMKTVRLLDERLGFEKGRLLATFQSLFGPREWLQPYTDKTVEKLAKSGVKNIVIINPGFVSDCVETLEEIAGEVAEVFHENGGEKFSHIPCLNASENGMEVIETLVRNELKGWI